MREERLAHRGNPGHLPRSRGSTEAIVTEGRGQNRSFFVQATPGITRTSVKRKSKKNSELDRSAIDGLSVKRAERKIMPASKDFLIEYRRDRSVHRRLVNVGGSEDDRNVMETLDLLCNFDPVCLSL